MRLKRARLLVFDLDGTLVDSRQDLASAVNAALHALGGRDLPLDEIASYVGDGALVLMQRAIQAAGLNAADPDLRSEGHQQFLTFYRAHLLDHTYVYPGVLDALETIRRRSPHVLMACLSNKPVAPSRIICEALALAPFFFSIYGGNSFSTKKPHPFGLQQLVAEAARLARAHPYLDDRPIHAGDTVMVGDGHADILAARAAETQVIGCDFSFSPNDLADAAPDALVTSPLDWVDLLCPNN